MALACARIWWLWRGPCALVKVPLAGVCARRTRSSWNHSRKDRLRAGWRSRPPLPSSPPCLPLQLSPALVPVLINALSEQGGFQQVCGASRLREAACGLGSEVGAQWVLRPVPAPPPLSVFREGFVVSYRARGMGVVG